MDSEREEMLRRLETWDAPTSAFLERVRTLTQAEWGRLDAAGAPLVGGSLVSRLERASLSAELLLVAVRNVSAVLWEMLWDEPAMLVDVARGASKEWSEWEEMWRDPEYRARLRALRTPHRELQTIAERQPAGPRAAHQALWYALTALMCRGFLPPRARVRLYGYAEAVIPYRSLV